MEPPIWLLKQQGSWQKRASDEQQIPAVKMTWHMMNQWMEGCFPYSLKQTKWAVFDNLCPGIPSYWSLDRQLLMGQFEIPNKPGSKSFISPELIRLIITQRLFTAQMEVS